VARQLLAAAPGPSHEDKEITVAVYIILFSLAVIGALLLWHLMRTSPRRSG
jgi:hypothetical protein